MKQEERLFDLIGRLPDELTSQTEAPKKRRISPQTRNRRIGIGVAACLVLAVGIWGVNAAPKYLWVDQSTHDLGTINDNCYAADETPNAETPKVKLSFPKNSGGMTEATLTVTMLPVNGHVAEYTQVENAASVAKARGFTELGENYADLEGWYLPDGTEALRYLVRQDEDGTHTLWEFSCFYVWDEETLDALKSAMENGEETFWSGIDWFGFDMDFTPYSYAEVLETVYGVHGAADIISVTVAPANMDNTDAGKKLQKEIGTLTVTDRAELDAVYSTLTGMTCYGGDHWELIDQGGADADGSLLTRVRLNRYLTIELADGSAINDLKYSAAGGQFYEYGGIAYSPLTANTAAQMNAFFNIEA